MSKPLLCVTVTAPNTAELRRRRDGVDTADLVELRLDSVTDPDVAGALEGRRRPVIVTCRPTWEGGAFAGSEDERRRVLEEALALGAEYVDVEWRARFDDLVKTGGRRIVLSRHDFTGVPRDLAEQASAMRATGAGVIKLAVQVARLSECLPLMTLGQRLARDGSVVLIAMGQHGVASRVLPGRFGSQWTYAGEVSGVGQLSPARLLGEYQFRSIGDSTGVYGLTGCPVSHSVSPAMHNAAFRALGLDAVYLPLPAADADDFVAFARAINLKGASVTIPFKVSLFDRMDEVDAAARRIGAINTISVKNGRWLGSNTDVAGFLLPLQERGITLEGTRAAILGAGGAARAVAIALAPTGARVTVHARDRERAAQVAMIVSGRTGPWPPVPGSWDLLVNCTPIGMLPHEEQTPLPAAALTGPLVYDLIYNPAQTRLMREAAGLGRATIGGLDMLVGQAHEQFHGWTGARPPAGVMRVAALERLAEFETDAHHVV